MSIAKLRGGLDRLEIPRYAQDIILAVIMDLANGAYHDIDDTNKAVRHMFVVFRDAATSALVQGGYMSTAAFARGVKRVAASATTDAPINLLLADLADQLLFAAQERFRETRRSTEGAG